MTPRDNTTVLAFEARHIPALYELCRNGSHETEERYFERSWEEQMEDRRQVFIATGADGIPCGYVHYNRFPRYQPFRRFEIPEIQDLYVAPGLRRQGVGAALMTACEAQAIKDGRREIGIGVGVGATFGAAQRLYCRRGYLPDGAGAVFEREPVPIGQVKPVDDRLCLMLLKDLT